MIEGRPNFIVVLGKRVQIDWVASFEDEGQLGEFTSNPLKITLVKSDENWKSTLLHEICHTIFFITGLDELIHPFEETLTKALENGLDGLVEIKV